MNPERCTGYAIPVPRAESRCRAEDSAPAMAKSRGARVSQAEDTGAAPAGTPGSPRVPTPSVMGRGAVRGRRSDIGPPDRRGGRGERGRGPTGAGPPSATRSEGFSPSKLPGSDGASGRREGGPRLQRHPAPSHTPMDRSAPMPHFFRGTPSPRRKVPRDDEVQTLSPFPSVLRVVVPWSARTGADHLPRHRGNVSCRESLRHR